MSRNTQLTDLLASAQGDALARLLDNGYFRIYDGVQPATANDPVGAGTLLATLRFAVTSAPASVGGAVTFNAIAPGLGVAVGDAAWFRLFKADGVTPVMDGSVGPSPGDYNLPMNAVHIVIGAAVAVAGYTHYVLEATAGD